MPNESRPDDDGGLDALLDEQRRFPPPLEFSRRARVTDPGVYDRAAADPTEFWAQFARELDWLRPWDQTVTGEGARTRWFVGGRLNAALNCVDRHATGARADRTALIWEGEPGDRRSWTYRDLRHEVCRLGNGLRRLGVGRGDRVAIYMPLIPEAVAAMLACARIGAVHSVVFGGFSSEALRDRIVDAGARLLITADGGYRRGTVIPLKNFADQALEQAPTIERVVVVRRGGFPVSMRAGRDVWYHELLGDSEVACPAESMEANDPLFTLYTSGTTGKPKGIVHSTGGYLTGTYATTRWVFDLRDEDVFWCTADIGWITGHSYVVYGPLAAGATVLIYEGAPDWPAKDRMWELCARHRVSIFYTAPTAIRAFMKWGDVWPAAHDLSGLRLLGTVGEPINPEAWTWYSRQIGGGRCPIVDTWWQTETGQILISPLPGLTTTKPGSATIPFPGIRAEILDDRGRVIREGGGLLAITSSWPARTLGIWGDDQRYLDTYWSRWPTPIYFPGDGAKRDSDGYFWILGRVDDVMNVAGHRLGTMEIESALVEHPAVAEAAVIGVPHEIKGTAIVAFVTLREGRIPEPDLVEQLKRHLVTKIGAIARPEQILLTADLPKTRSGKIMRRLLRDVAEGRTLGDTSTLADASVIDALKSRYDGDES